MANTESETGALPSDGDSAGRPQAASLLTYFALTFLAAWTLWIAAATVAAGPSVSSGLRELLFLPGTFAPGIVAIWLTARAEGHAGIRALLGRLFVWQVSAWWYVFAAGYMAGVKLTVAVVHRILTGAWPTFGEAPWYLLLVATAFSAPFQAGEEVGWRGYALPRLASCMGLARASLLLGVIWASWHLPLFFIPGTSTTGQSFPVYLLGVTAISVTMAWLFGNTRGSLLLVMLMHAAINNTKDIVPSAVPVPDAANPLTASASQVAWLAAALMWAGAAYFLARMPRSDLSLARTVAHAADSATHHES